MKENGSIIEKIIVLVFGNPWIVCFITTMLGVMAVWFSLDSSVYLYSKLAVGAIIGFAIGIINVIEMHSNNSIFLKRLFGSIIGIISAIISAYLLRKGAFHYFVYAVVGSGLGATARNWSKHINFL